MRKSVDGSVPPKTCSNIEKTHMSPFKILAISLSAALFTGCGALYSETRDKQAQDLRTSIKKIDFQKAIDANEKHRGEIYAEQTELIKGLKEQELRRFANQLIGSDPSSTVESHLRAIENADDATKIFGKLPEDSATRKVNRTARGDKVLPIDKLQQSIVASRRSISNLQSTIEMTGFPAPQCSEFLDGNETVGTPSAELRKWLTDNSNSVNRAKILGPVLDELSITCAEAKKFEEELALQVKEIPVLKSAVENIEKKEKSVIEARKEGSKLVAEYKSLQTEIADAMKSANEQSLAASQKKIADARAKLYKSGNSFAIWAIFRLNAEKIDRVLEEVEKFDPDKVDDVPLSSDAKSLLFILQIRDAVGSTSTKAAPWNALAIRRDVEKAQVDAAARDLKSQQKIVDLARQELYLKTNYAIAIGKFGAAIAKKDEKDIGKPLAFLLSGAVPGAKKTAADILSEATLRRDLYKHLADLMVVQHRYERDMALLGIERAKLEYEKSVSYSTASYAQWSTLLNAAVASLEASTKAGWREGEINSIVQTIMLGGIVKGTN